MPEPIHSNGDSSVYDPALEVSLTDACDPSTATCAAQPPASHTATTNASTAVGGDAGTRELLRRHAEAQCLDEKGGAVLTCGVATLTATKAVLTAATGIAWPLAALEVGITALNAVNCMRVVVAYQDCVDEQLARAEDAAKCEAEGGVLLVGGRSNEPVCLVLEP